MLPVKVIRINRTLNRFADFPHYSRISNTNVIIKSYHKRPNRVINDIYKLLKCIVIYYCSI